MDLRLEDSLSVRSRSVGPSARTRPVTLYVCGPTVYDAAHVGHARTYLVFDLARRFLEAEGRRVRHVMNITDVEDKISRRAVSLGTTWRALARREERWFFQDLDALGVLRPTLTPRASEVVPEMVRIARALERTGRVHREPDGWTYDAPARPAGANFLTSEDLARHAVEEPSHPFHPEPDGGRRILLWKPQRRPLPSWPSPWGPGVPGWHLECFAIARKFLGVPVELHGGGRDLLYPHHFAENELALALTGTPFANLFLHTGFVLQDGAKMAKSSGNLVPLRTALAAVGPGALRWYLLSRPPRERLDWDADELARAAATYEAVRERFGLWLAPGAGGRFGAERGEALGEACRRELSRGLRADRVLAHLERFTEELGAHPSPRAPRGDRLRARAALRTIEQRTGLSLT